MRVSLINVSKTKSTVLEQTFFVVDAGNPAQRCRLSKILSVNSKIFLNHLWLCEAVKLEYYCPRGLCNVSGICEDILEIQPK